MHACKNLVTDSVVMLVTLFCTGIHPWDTFYTNKFLPFPHAILDFIGPTELTVDLIHLGGTSGREKIS